MAKQQRLIALFVLLGLLVAGCTPAAIPTSQAPAEEAGDAAETAGGDGPSGSVVWWALAEYNFEEYADDLVAAYEEHSPNVDLQMEILPEGSYTERLLPALASGEGPDVFVLVFVPKLTRPTVALELEPFVEGPNGVDLSEWNMDALGVQGVVEDKLYGMPRDMFGGEGWFINKDLFDQFGVAYPEEGWTWTDMLALAPQVTDKENRIYGFAVDNTITGEDFGFQPVSDDGRSIVGYFDSDEAIEAIRVYKQLYDCCSPSFDQQNTEFQDSMGGGAGPLGAFISGRTAIAPLDVGTYPLLDEAGINWGYIPRPLPDNPENWHKPTQVYVVWGINKNTENPEGAWDFLKWLTAKDHGATFLARSGYFVPFREPLEATGYPQEILDVRFAEVPADWKPPVARIFAVPCFTEGGLAEWQNTFEQVLNSPEEQLEQLVHEGAQRAQEAIDACWEKREAGG